jgi:hypothetical protein
MSMFAVAVTVPFANTVLVEVLVLSSATEVGSPVRMDAETSPLQSSSMNTGVCPSFSEPLESVIWKSVPRWIPPGTKPFSAPVTGASR